MSRKARTSAFSNRISAGIFFATILQKRQSDIGASVSPGEALRETTVSRDREGRNSSALYFDRGDPQSLREPPQCGIDARAIFGVRVKPGNAGASSQVRDAGVLHIAQDSPAVD